MIRSFTVITKLVRVGWSDTHDGVEVGLHELLVEIHFVEIPVRAKDDVHVIQTSDLCRRGRGTPERE